MTYQLIGVLHVYCLPIFQLVLTFLSNVCSKLIASFVPRVWWLYHWASSLLQCNKDVVNFLFWETTRNYVWC